MSDRLKEFADDCRSAAEVYTKSPGLAGHGVNAGTVIDIYIRIALALDAIRETLPLHQTQPAGNIEDGA